MFKQNIESNNERVRGKKHKMESLKKRIKRKEKKKFYKSVILPSQGINNLAKPCAHLCALFMKFNKV